jgi:hypothetical protein
MNKEYIFSEKEYAALIGLTKEGVRTRRRSGKLDGQFIKKEDKQYFYCRPERTEKKETQFRRRGVHKDGGQTNYPNEAFKKHNEKKNIIKATRSG